MRRVRAWFPVLIIFSTIAALSHAESPPVHVVETEHYRVSSELGDRHAAELALRLEANARLYNEYFRFDMEDLTARLQVKVFATRLRFTEHLASLFPERREEYVYLHYTDPARSVLLLFDDPGNIHDDLLNHQSFIQFLKAFVSHPPLWIREGFAVYFERTEYDPRIGKAVVRENRSWLPAIKSLLSVPSGLLPLETLLAGDPAPAPAHENIAVFYPQAWALVAFLLETQSSAYSRLLWDSIRLLSPSDTAEANARRIIRRALTWVDRERLETDFAAFYAGKKTAGELLAEGMKLYEEADLVAAEEMFLQALAAGGVEPPAHYYLGLIAYEKKEYGRAADSYHSALRAGAHPGLTWYALGVNAFAAGNTDEARMYLEKARDEQSGAYGDRAREILTRLGR